MIIGSINFDYNYVKTCLCKRSFIKYRQNEQIPWYKSTPSYILKKKIMYWDRAHFYYVCTKHLTPADANPGHEIIP